MLIYVFEIHFKKLGVIYLFLNIVVPCYNEQNNLVNFHKEIIKILDKEQFDFQIIMVNDGSSDNTLGILKDLAKMDHRVRYISFSRNFGKEAAMLAGLKYSNSETIIIMDADLQHPPELIPKMIEGYFEGFDQVIAKRNRKGDSVAKSVISRAYYRLMNQYVDVNLTNGIGDFRLLSRKAVDALLSLTEYNRFSKGLFSWIGFKEKIIDYENIARIEGESKWSFSKLLNYGIDGVISFNNKPLRLSIYLGLLVTLIGLIYIIATLVGIIFNGIDQPGYFTIIASILLFGGIQLIFLGIIGEYIGRIYYETKKRPHFIIESQNINYTQKIREKEIE
jgi:polyisoprenyl-phosphate glycosyltransferase